MSELVRWIKEIGQRSMNFTAIDFETANSSRVSACSVGVCIVQDGQIVQCHQRLIRPEPLYFSPFNVSIHGITETDVEVAPAFADLWPELLAGISGPLVAHNASFDVSVIRGSLDAAGIEYPDLHYFCTRVMAKLAWPGMPTYGLDHLGYSQAGSDLRNIFRSSGLRQCNGSFRSLEYGFGA